MGSVTWGLNPDGTWGQSTTLNGGAQNLFNTTINGQTALGSAVGAGAPQASFGAQQNVIDAWNALQQPGLDKEANAARARAAAMGITLGSNASNDVENTIGTNAATSRNQGILKGVDAYNQLYQNQLAGYNANVSGMSALTGVRDSLNPNKWAASVPASATYVPQTIYGAAMDTFNANKANENASQVASNASAANTANYVKAAAGLAGTAYNVWSNWG